jgi:hypothetical protein
MKRGVGWLIMGVEYVGSLNVDDLAVELKVEKGAIRILRMLAACHSLCELVVQLELAGGVLCGGGHYCGESKGKVGVSGG